MVIVARHCGQFGNLIGMWRRGLRQLGCPGALDGFEFMRRHEPFGGWFVNGSEKLGHWGGVTVYHRPDDCRSKSVRMATLQE